MSPGLVAAGRSSRQRLALSALASFRFALTLDAGWLVVPATFGLGEDAVLQHTATEALESDLERIALANDDV